jgi:hypothetical protein
MASILVISRCGTARSATLSRHTDATTDTPPAATSNPGLFLEGARFTPNG